MSFAAIVAKATLVAMSGVPGFDDIDGALGRAPGGDAGDRYISEGLTREAGASMYPFSGLPAAHQHLSSIAKKGTPSGGAF